MVLGAVVLGGLICLSAVRDGPGTGPDGSAYLGAAGNMAAGRGLSVPFSSTVDELPPADAAAFGDRVPLLRWPPGLPVVLAGTMKVTGRDALGAAGLLLVGLGAANLGLVAFLAVRFGGSVLAGVLACVLVGTQEHWRILHTVVSSEPLLIFLLLLATVALLGWLEDQRRVALLLLAAGAGVVAPLVRYAGFAIPVAVAATFLAWGSGSIRAKLRGAALFLAAAALPVGLWLVSRVLVSGTESHKVARVPDPEELRGALGTVTAWFAPSGAPVVLRWVAWAVVLVSLGFVAWAVLTRRWSVFPFGPVLLIIAVYCLVLVLSASYFGEISLRGRLLSPVLPLVATLVAMAMAALVAEQVPRRPWVREAVVVPVVLVVLVGWFAPPDALTIPLDPATEPSMRSASGGLAPGTEIFTTNPAGVWQATGRSAYALPSRTNQESGSVNSRYGAWLSDVGQRIADGRAVAVWLEGDGLLAPNQATVPELVAAAGGRATVDHLPGGVNVVRR